MKEPIDLALEVLAHRVVDVGHEVTDLALGRQHLGGDVRLGQDVVEVLTGWEGGVRSLETGGKQEQESNTLGKKGSHA